MPLSSSIHNIAIYICYVGINYNYTRWLPMHVREMLNVRVKHPALYRQFADVFFTIAKTQNPFSMI